MNIKRNAIAGVSGTLVVFALSVSPALAAPGECVDDTTYPPSLVECETNAGDAGTTVASTGSAMPSTGASSMMPVVLGLGALGVGGGLVAVARSRRSEV